MTQPTEIESKDWEEKLTDLARPLKNISTHTHTYTHTHFLRRFHASKQDNLRNHFTRKESKEAESPQKSLNPPA